MGQVFNTKVIQSVLNIEENMLNSIKKISEFNDFSDINSYNDEVERLKLFYKKENLLISKIPDDIDFYNYLFEVLKKSSFGLKSENIVLSRFRSILYNNYLSLKPKYEGVNINEEDDFYDGEIIELKAKVFIRDNLLIEYLKSFDEPMQIMDRKNYVFFNRIRLYNVFLNKNLFDFWIKSGFDFDNINYCTDDEAIKYLNISKDDYYYLLNETVSDCCCNLLTDCFSDVKKSKSNITVQDSFFNFIFLLKKLSTESLMSIKSEMYDVYKSVGDYGILSDVLDAIDGELENRDVMIQNENEKFLIDSTLFDKIINLVKLEDKIFDLYSGVDFNSINNDLNMLNEYILFEKDLIKEIDVSSSLITILNDLFENSLWIYLTGDVDKKSYIISQRLSNLFPFYKDLKILPSQKIESYNFIYKNHLVRSLNNLWNLKLECKDDVLKAGLEEVYSFYYFINPDLTDELLALDGSHTLIYDLPEDLSGLDDIEYKYDQNEQLYNLGCEIISYIFDNEDNINSVFDYSEYQFKINELIDIISNLSLNYERKLYRYLMNYSSFFSPLRRDIRKIFKEDLKIKTIGK